MTMRRYLSRAAAVQCAVSLFSCGVLRADLPAIPEMVLTPDQVQIAGQTGIMVGLATAVVMYLVIVIMLLVQVRSEVHQMKRLLRRVMEVD